MSGFQNCRLELQLEAQSPMIHFQANNAHPGVTVRASEVKPKLDKFLLRKLCKNNSGCNVKELKKKYPSFFVDQSHDALNYKMTIVQEQGSDIVELSGRDNRCKYDLYYGNIGISPDEKKRGVFSNPKIIIFCMVAELRDLIQEYIIEFFLVTNFGTMQNKGFGSFLPTECGYENILNPEQTKQIAAYLSEDVADAMDSGKKCKKTCYSICFGAAKQTPVNEKNEYCAEIFKEIKQFYSIMKSGRNSSGEYIRSYIYEYMHSQNIDNEKAWMKQQGISPALSVKGRSSTAGTKNRSVNEPKYVRALLGTTESLSYIAKKRKRPEKDDRVSINISPVNKQINRVASPIYFKVIKNVVFIVAREVPKEVLGEKYIFKNKVWQKKGYLKTPDEFDIEDFLEKYVHYYNQLFYDENEQQSRKVEIVECIAISESQ